MKHIGILADYFGKGNLSGIGIARQLGFDCVQLNFGQFVDPVQTDTDLRACAEIIPSSGLHVSALCARVGFQAFYHPDKAEQSVAFIKGLMPRCREFNTDKLIINIGGLDEKTSRYKELMNLVKDLCRDAKKAGIILCLETVVKSEILRSFCDAVGSESLGVNFDNGNLYMFAHDDPVTAVSTLEPYIKHVHLKDGVFKKQIDVNAIFSPDMQKPDLGEFFLETKLGEGNLDLVKNIEVLKAFGYLGDYVLEQSVFDTALDDAAFSLAYLANRISI